MTLRTRKKTWASININHPEYIRFYNSLWLVANDVIMGIAMGTYLIENASQVAELIDSLSRDYTINGLHRTITWLMGWPGGLKLNNELATFMGDLFLWVIDYWAGCIASLRPYFPTIVYMIGLSGFAGATMPISIFSDLLTLLTLHVSSFYIASARIYHWQLTTIISLFHLFRGKRRNVLRKRIDSCEYELDQLLLGTIFFTLLTFLMPTVLVFYLTFASARMVIMMAKAILETILVCLNHFPLFAVMLRLKDPTRLPGGIRFELHSMTFEREDYSTSYIVLRPIPLALKHMFHQYFEMSRRMRKHYLSFEVMLCLIEGRFVPPMPREQLYSLQYSMLPGHRTGIWQLWARLHGTS